MARIEPEIVGQRNPTSDIRRRKTASRLKRTAGTAHTITVQEVCAGSGFSKAALHARQPHLVVLWCTRGARRICIATILSGAVLRLFRTRKPAMRARRTSSAPDITSHTGHARFDRRVRGPSTFDLLIGNL